MKRVILVFTLAIVWLFNPWPLYSAATVQVEFFWGDGCPHCERVKPTIDDLERRYPEVEFKRYEVYGNPDNAMLLMSRYSEYGMPNERGVPAVFIGKSVILGDTPIIDGLENKIISALALLNRPAPVFVPDLVISPENKPDTEAVAEAPTLTNENVSDQPEGEGEVKVIMPAYENKPYSLWAITGAAVVDSINPCAIAVLLILLTALMVGAGDKKRALKGGLAFALSIYITYFLFGLGLLQLIAFTNLAGVIAKFVGVVAIIIGLANVKDFIAYGGGGFVMEIPRSWRPTLKKILNSVTSPLGAFLAGFAVTLFELPCTGGPYFFVLGLLAQAKSIQVVLPVLLYYNLVFILPLLIIIAVVYFGLSSVKKTEAWKEKNIKLLHLVGGIIMLALGVWIFLN